MALGTLKQPSLQIALALAGSAAAGGLLAWWLWNQHRKTSLADINKQIQVDRAKKNLVIVSNPQNIMDCYDFDRKGAQKGVRKAICKEQGQSSKIIRAVKSINKSKLQNLERYNFEIAIMQKMDHPSIIKLFDHFDDREHTHLVMECCTGGELFERIIQAGHFNEVQAAIIMKQVLQAVNYMHENGVCHRDIKPENFLFMTAAPVETSLLKLIDFGLACFFTPADGDKILTTIAGTPYYMAPQVLTGKYDHRCDLWSCGVLMYVLHCGYPPFYGETDADVLSKVRLGNFSFHAADWKAVSEDAKNLIRMLLRMNPHNRYDAKQALNHVWIKSKILISSPDVSEASQ